MIWQERFKLLTAPKQGLAVDIRIPLLDNEL